MAISTNGLQLARIAGAVFNQQLSASDYSEILAANKTAAELDSWANAAVAAEFRNKTTTDIAKAVLANIGLSDVAGLEAWVAGQLTAGGGVAKAGATMMAMLNDFSNMTADATYGAAATSFNQKAANSQSLSQTSGTKTGTFAAVSSVEASSTLTLTASGNATTAGVDNLTGGSGNDTFNALILNSLDNSDNLSGGAGVDTLNARFDMSTSNVSTVSIAPQISGIETVTISGFGADNAGDNVTFSGLNTSGITSVVVKDDSSTTAGNVEYTINNLTKAVPVGVVGGQVNAAGTGLGGDITVTYSAASVAGTADEATFQLGTNNVAGYANIVSIANIETLNLDAAAGGGRIGTLTATAAKTLNIIGGKSVTIGDLSNSTAVTKIVASGATGNLALGSSSSGGLIDATTSVVAGSGNDTIWVTTSRISSTDTIDGGEGTDTIGLIGGLASTIPVMNFEKVRVGDTGGSYDLDKLSGSNTSISDIRIDSTGGTATFTGVKTATAVQVTGDAPSTISLTTKGSADTLTINLDNGTGAAADGVDITTLTVTGATTLNITSNDNLAQLTTNEANSVGGITVATVNVAATARTEVTSTRSTATTVNASESTARVDITATSTTAGTLTGGANNDSITSGTGNDVISGGAGNDTITSATGNDTLNGDVGNDTFVFSSFAAITSADVINGGDGVDTLSITENADVNFTTDITRYTGISNVERVSISNTAAARTTTINDSTVSQFGGDMTIVMVGDQGATVDLSGVGASGSKVTVNAASQTAAITVKIGAGTETLAGFNGAYNDAVTADLPGYLQAADKIDAGAGSNTFTFAGGTTATTYTVTAAQLAALRSFTTITVDDGTDADTSRLNITLNDTVVSQNNSGNALTVSRAISDTGGILVVTATDVSATYALTLTGGGAKDTLTGGAGNDIITGGANDSDADRFTGGTGNDIFRIDANGSAVDVITDINFGTSATSVDQIDFTTLGTALSFSVNEYDKVGLFSAGYSADNDVDVLIFNTASYAALSDVDTAVESWSTAVTGLGKDLVLVWADTLGQVHVSAAIGANGGNASADQGDEYTLTDYFTLEGVTLTGVSTIINTTDFKVAS